MNEQSKFFRYIAKVAFPLSNKSGEKIAFTMGTLWEQLNGTQIVIYGKNNQRRITISPEIIKSLTNLSLNQKPFNTSDSFFEVDKVSKQSAEAWQGLLDNINQHLQAYYKIFKKNDMAANYLKIAQLLDPFVENLKLLEKVDPLTDFKQLGMAQQLAVKYFNTNLSILDLPLKNIKSKTEPFKYTPELETRAMKWFSDAEGYLVVGRQRDPEISMVRCHTVDFLDILKIAYYTNQGSAQNAKEVSNLDTVVRDELPRDFWDNIARADSLQLEKIDKAAKIFAIRKEKKDLKVNLVENPSSTKFKL